MEKQKDEQNDKINNSEEENEDETNNEEEDNLNEEDENQEEVHPPQDGSQPSRAPRNHNDSGTVLTLSNSVSQHQPFTQNTSEENSQQSLDISNTAMALFTFGGSRDLAHDSLTIEPDTTIHGSPRKVFGDFSDTSGYSDPIGDEDDENLNQKRKNKNAKGQTANRAQSTRQARNSKDAKGKLSKTQKSNKNTNQTSPTSRRKQYDDKNKSHALLGSSSSSISDSSGTSVPTSEISVSTLNPSDFSENFPPDMQAIISPRYQNQNQQITKPTTQDTAQSARSVRPNTNSKYPPVVKVKQPVSGTKNKSFNNSRPAPPTRRRQQNSNSNTQSTLNTTANTSASVSRRRRPLYLPPIKEDIPEPTEEMKKLMDRAINKDKLDDLQDSDYEDLIFNLQQERRRKASDRSFSMGEKINEALKYVKSCQLKYQKAERLKVATAEYNKEFEQLKALIQEFDDETQKEKEELKLAIQDQRNQIIENHKYQISELREHWTSPNKVRMYNHASNDLTAMKKKRKFLLMQARFNEASEVDHSIKEKKKNEEAFNQESYQQGFDAALKNLLEKQKEELNFFDENSKIQIEKLIQRREKRRVSFNNQLKRFEARAELLKDADKLWNSEQFSRRDNMNTKMMMGARAGQPSGRILANDVQETEDGDNAVLDLAPLDFREKTEKKKEKKKKKVNPEEEEDDMDLNLNVPNEIPNE
ncbi:hypothetical protein M9Y10_041372 [Tritrichomonas musculus]|uniref:Uncharacterized protein n=1 Tax=Tritrichomonas musculus TaxID=1915356 RepID=A0ABR2K456_9EUKA